MSGRFPTYHFFRKIAMLYIGTAWGGKSVNRTKLANKYIVKCCKKTFGFRNWEVPSKVCIIYQMKLLVKILSRIQDTNISTVKYCADIQLHLISLFTNMNTNIKAGIPEWHLIHNYNAPHQCPQKLFIDQCSQRQKSDAKFSKSRK